MTPLVDDVPDTELARGLLLLAVACADAAGVGAEAAVAGMFTQWRDDGRVGPSTLADVGLLGAAADAAASDQCADTQLRDAAFHRARALAAIRFAASGADLPSESRREALRESAYEASFVLNGVVGVGGVLASSAAPR